VLHISQPFAITNNEQEILLYLLQLVQALKFETEPTPSTRTQRRREAPTMHQEGESGLAQFLIDRAVANPVFSITFHWYLMIEVGSQTPTGKMYGKVAIQFQAKLAEVRS
jgi:phosphatidylinositol 3-kinase